MNTKLTINYLNILYHDETQKNIYINQEDLKKAFKAKAFYINKVINQEYLQQHKLNQGMLEFLPNQVNILDQHNEEAALYTKGENPHVFRELKNRQLTLKAIKLHL